MKKEELKKLGFTGFESVKSLMDNDCASVLKEGGVYVVLRTSKTPPIFLKEGTGGHFKEVEPNEDISLLKNKWIEEEEVVYIGKAKKGKNRSLKKRLQEYMGYGQGRAVGHAGGKNIWQLKDSRELLVCWKAILDKDPEDVEDEMLVAFEKAHDGKLPFANRKRPRKKARK